MANHVRNVAGHNLIKVTEAVYKEMLGNGKYRLYVRFFQRVKRVGIPKDFYWRYTPIGDDNNPPIQVSTKHYPTLTACVMAANP